jgi:hypothetical protein
MVAHIEGDEDEIGDEAEASRRMQADLPLQTFFSRPSSFCLIPEPDSPEAKPHIKNLDMISIAICLICYIATISMPT